MFKITVYYWVLIIIPLLHCPTSFGLVDNLLKFYEFGTRDKSDKIAYTYTGLIGSFYPEYKLSIPRPPLTFQQKYTYIKVAYANLVSVVKIDFDSQNFIMSFHIKFPFIETPFGIIGYALPLG